MPDVRGANRERCVSYVTLRRVSKKCKVAKKPHGDEKAPAIAGQGKLAERIEVEFGPFRSASSSRRAECLLVALPTSWDLLLCAKD